MITDIRLQNFRSYADDSFEFDPGVNIIVGPNASGKTNLLEAILVSCRGSSYRARDNELVRFGAAWARLDAHTPAQARIVKLVPASSHQAASKQLEVDGLKYVRFTLPRQLPVVLFEPQHLVLLSGGPELRRSFMDDLLEQTVAGFGLLRRQYKRALAQRNTLLKGGRSSGQDQLFAWNVRLSELGGQIYEHRQNLLKRLNEKLSTIYGEIAHQPANAKLVYESSCPVNGYGSAMLRKLESGTELDYHRGFTAYGPHRDDAAPYLGGHRTQESASRGELRSLLLALKILELQLLEQARGQSPLLLLDDVFSELDGKRRRALTGFLQPYQTFITTTDADVVVQHFMNDCHIIPTTAND